MIDKSQLPVMEASISLGTVRRSRDSDVTDSVTGKRRRLSDRQNKNNVFQLQYHSQRDADVENVASTTVTASSDHVHSSFLCSVIDDSISDLKAECVSETEVFMSVNDGFSRDTSRSSIVCLETEEIESVSTSKPKNNNKKESLAPAVVAEDEATSRRKPPSAAAQIPCAAEIEEFFSKAEKYEQRRFAEKYNYDIVKDVPMEGRYQWIQLKP